MSDPIAPAYEPIGPDANLEGRQDGPRHGTLARLGLAFTSPGEVFADILRKPSWAVVLVLLTLLGVGAQLVAIPHVDMAQTIRDRAASQGQQLSDEQLDTIMERAGKFAYIGPAASVVIFPLIMAIIAAVFFLGLKLAGSESDYSRVFSATLYSFWPATVVSSVLLAVLIQRVGKLPAEAVKHLVRSNVGAFLSSDAPAALRSVADSIDLFSIWILVLLVLGLAIVGRVSRGKAAVAVLVPWALFVAAKAAIAGFFG